MIAAPRGPIRAGMIGGGEGAFIGQYHRMAMRLSGRYELVAGAFSSDAAKAAANAALLGVDRDRSYEDFAAMAAAEAARSDGIEAVAIVTPNHLHLRAAEAFLAAGIPVFCEKPLATCFAEAQALARAHTAAGVAFGVAHTYAGYAMVRHARTLVAQGAIGEVRGIQVEYVQGWLSDAIERGGNKQASWRTDPAIGGAGGLLGDIGTHAFHLAEYVTGLRCTALAADLSNFVEGREVPDDARLLLRFEGAARGMLWASQVAIGNANALRLRVMGTRGSLDWRQEHPNDLVVTNADGVVQTLARGAGAAAPGLTGLPSGHPEGFIEALAQLYGDFADWVVAGEPGDEQDTRPGQLPTLADGLRGMAFIEAALASGRADGAWASIAA